MIARARAAIATRRTDIAWALGTGAAALLVAAWVMRLWHADLRIPFEYSGDNMLNLVAIKTMFEHGWYQVNPDLGAPLGMRLYDFPAFAGDHLHMLILKSFGLVTSNPGAAENVYFLLGFPASAITAFAVLRRLSVSRPAAAVGGLLFALLPDHFLRGQQHVFLGLTWSVPFGVYLALRAFEGAPLFAWRADGPRALRWASSRTLKTLAICVLMATTGIYYAAFTAALVLAGAGAAAVAGRRPRVFLSGAAVAAAIGAVVVLNLSPTILYHADHGENPLVGHRQPHESDVYALKVTDLLLPIEHHRVGPLADLRERYETTRQPYYELGLGTLGAAGALGLLVLLAAFLAGAVRSDPRWPPPLLRRAGAAAWLAVLATTVGGLGTIFAYVVDPQFRGLQRMSVFIGFLALLAAALSLDALRRRLAPLRRGAIVWGALVAVVAVLGALDQTSPTYAGRFAQTKDAFLSDRTFARAIDAAMPDGASIFQLPYVSFPESAAVEAMDPYGHFRPWLHVSNLRLSFPGVLARTTNWAARLAGATPRQAVFAAAASGFDGLYLDRQGLADRGRDFESAVKSLIGPPDIVSPRQDTAFWDLRELRAQLAARYGQARLDAAREATIFPLRIIFGDGFYGFEPRDGNRYHWANARAVMRIYNSAQDTRRTTLRATLVTAEPAPVTFRWPDGSRIVVERDEAQTHFTHAFELHPGWNEIAIETPAEALSDPARDLRVAIVNPELTRNPAFVMEAR